MTAPSPGKRPPRPSSPRRPGPQAKPKHHPVLALLEQHHPKLFGPRPLPLKRGIYHDLLQTHAESIQAEDLKTALALHTRSSRYLVSVGQGLPRHDLQGEVVEAMAPEHVLQALLEVWRRRQGRGPHEDTNATWRPRIAAAFLASGLEREAYLQLLPRLSGPALNLLTEALDMGAAQQAKDAALYRAYQNSGMAPEVFADSYGLPLSAVNRLLQRRAPEATVSPPSAT